MLHFHVVDYLLDYSGSIIDIFCTHKLQMFPVSSENQWDPVVSL